MDVDSIRKDFPTVRNGRGIYLDSACQALRPDQVIRAITEYYEEYPACGGRSVHSMATRVSVQLQLTDPTARSRDRVVKKSEKGDLYTALDVGCVWLERALAGK